MVESNELDAVAFIRVISAPSSCSFGAFKNFIDIINVDIVNRRSSEINSIH